MRPAAVIGGLRDIRDNVARGLIGSRGRLLDVMLHVILEFACPLFS